MNPKKKKLREKRKKELAKVLAEYDFSRMEVSGTIWSVSNFLFKYTDITHICHPHYFRSGYCILDEYELAKALEKNNTIHCYVDEGSNRPMFRTLTLKERIEKKRNAT